MWGCMLRDSQLDASAQGGGAERRVGRLVWRVQEQSGRGARAVDDERRNAGVAADTLRVGTAQTGERPGQLRGRRPGAPCALAPPQAPSCRSGEAASFFRHRTGGGTFHVPGSPYHMAGHGSHGPKLGVLATRRSRTACGVPPFTCPGGVRQTAGGVAQRQPGLLQAQRAGSCACSERRVCAKASGLLAAVLGCTGDVGALTWRSGGFTCFVGVASGRACSGASRSRLCGRCPHALSPQQPLWDTVAAPAVALAAG